MQIIDRGSGAPVVLVPGVQGRWEWLRPAVDALAARCRVVTFSLPDVPREALDAPGTSALKIEVDHVAAAMDEAGVERAVICGVSYGGLIAAAFAARHPERTAGLVLVSALHPAWRPNARVRFFLRAPRLLTPLFMLNSLRLYREMLAASGGLLPSIALSLRHAVNVLTHMFSPVQMARRVLALENANLEPELARLTVPTLVVTGEDRLDLVVPAYVTREYLKMWPHAEHATMERTGHLGLITRPQEFARLVCPFVERAFAAPARRRSIG